VVVGVTVVIVGAPPVVADKSHSPLLSTPSSFTPPKRYIEPSLGCGALAAPSIVAFMASGPSDVSLICKLRESMPNDIIERDPDKSLPPTANIVVALLASAPKERATIGIETCSLLQTKAIQDDDPGAEKVERGQAVQTEREVAGVTVLYVFSGQGLQSRAIWPVWA
jgi:hypothetical protein